MHGRDALTGWYRGKGRWDEEPDENWASWHWQLQNRIATVEEFSEHICLTEEEREGFRFANKKLAVSVTPYFLNLIESDNPNCPIRRQVVPRVEEMETAPEEMLDPVGEEKTMPVPGIVHRYPDRVLFLVTDRCAAYCRYCTRSRMVSNSQDYNFHSDLEGGLEYIEGNTEVRDVLLSGGDPLLFSDRKLEYLLGRLRRIEHVEFVRIGSRVPVFVPQRITDEVCAILKENGPVWMSLHINHPSECTHELYEACEKLSYAGVPLGNQSVLLRGVNDDLETMQSLVHRLLMMRVRPYYLYQCDLITGSAHLRTDVATGIEIIRGLRGHTSGYAVPQFVIDAPGGGGKIPLNPDYVERINDDEVVLRNYENKVFRYPLVKGNVPVRHSLEETVEEVLL